MTSLDGLRALEQAASPGPWRAHDDHWIFDAADEVVFAGAMLVPDDAEFVVAARNALPGLLGRVAAAEAERDAVRTGIRRARSRLSAASRTLHNHPEPGESPHEGLPDDCERFNCVEDRLALAALDAVLAASVPSGPAAGGET